MTCATQIIGLVVGVVFVGGVLVLIDGGRVEPRSARFGLALLMPSLLILVTLGVAALWVMRRARRLDLAFAPLGLSGRQSGVMRSWHGELDGREVDVWFHRGPTLEIYMSTTPATRGVIHTGGPLIRAIGEKLDRRAPLEPPPFDLERATFYCYDEGWMRRLLERAAAENAIRALMTDTHRSASSVFFGPTTVRYMRRFMPVGEVTADNVRGWLTEIETLADEVDRLGPSDDGLEPTKLEAWGRKRRGSYLNRIFAGLGIFLVLAMGALFVFGWFFVGQS